MARQNINIGTVANDGTGDDLRVAMQKVNDNFTELYGASPFGQQITIAGNEIRSNTTNANLKLTASGTGVIEFEGVQIRDNHIEATRSNDDLVLGASGTGNVVVEGIRINGTEISSDDSSQITLKENVLVTGTLNASTIDVNILQSSDSTAIRISDDLNVQGVLSVNTIDTNFISSNDSTEITIDDRLYVSGLTTLHDLFVLDDNITIGRDWSDDSTRATSIGKTGDVRGMWSWGDDYIYICTGNYDGSTVIWKRAALSTF